jgi:hypothetical protein
MTKSKVCAALKSLIYTKIQSTSQASEWVGRAPPRQNSLDDPVAHILTDGELGRVDGAKLIREKCVISRITTNLGGFGEYGRTLAIF